MQALQDIVQGLSLDPRYAPAALASLGVLLAFLLGRLSVRRRVTRGSDENARLEHQVREQSRQLSRIQKEHSSLANLMRALPDVVAEINRPELDLRKVSDLLVRLGQVTFEPQQILLYLVRSPGSDAEPKELLLQYSKGVVPIPNALERVPIGIGKIGFVAAHKVEMTAEDWSNETRTGGETVLDNAPEFCSDLLGPLIQRGHDGDRILGVLCLGRPVVRPVNEKMLLQMITSIGSIAMMKSISMGQLRHQAQRDGLTGLINKRQMMLDLSMMTQEAEAKGENVGLFIFDIDHFKTYNDTNGHLAGDELLKAIAKLIRDSLRPGDLAARYGGEEFVIAMPNTPREAALRVAERVRRGIEEHVFSHEENQPGGTLTISGGVATFPHDALSVTDLISHADQALYQSKAAGRNRVCLFRAVEFGDVDLDPYETYFGPDRP